MEISSKFLTENTPTSTKEAWAAYARRRFPRDCLSHVQRLWDLTEGEARGLVWGTISQRTIDKIRAHKRGGLLVSLDVEALIFGSTVEDLIATFIAKKREGIADERRRLDAEDQRARALDDRCRAARGGGAHIPNWQAATDL